MILVDAFIEVLLPVLVVVSCGYVLRRQFALDLRSLNRVSMYVLSPSLIFVTLVRFSLPGDEAMRISLASILICLGMGAITAGIGAVQRTERHWLAAMLLTTMFMNSGNYGLSINTFAFGDEGLQRALLYFIPQAIMSQVLAIPIASLGRGAWRDSLMQILKMPQIYAVLAGLLIRASGWNPALASGVPAALFDGMELVSDAALPFLLLILGMQLAQGVAIEAPARTAQVVGLRLVASPLLAAGVTLLLGLDDISRSVVMLQAAMPTAVNMVLYSLEFEAHPGFVAGVVVASTLGSLVTVTLLLALVRA